jgi:hypothetical protein
VQNAVRQWLQTKERAFYQAGIHALVQTWKKTADTDAILKNNYTFSKVGAKFCYIFMYPPCKHHETKQEGPLFSDLSEYV